MVSGVSVEDNEMELDLDKVFKNVFLNILINEYIL